MTKLNARIEELNRTHEEAVKTLNDAHLADIKTLQDSHKEVLNVANAATETANEQLEEAQKQLAAKEAELKELSGVTTQAPKPETPPTDNAVGATKTEPELATKPVYHDGMSLDEASKAYKERMSKLDNRFNK